MITLNQIQEVLSKYNHDNCVFSTEISKKMSPDSDLHIILKYDGITLGICGVSFGLRGYYEDVDGFPLDRIHEYENAIKHAEGKWGFTHMQATNGTTNLRKKINFHRELLKVWGEIAKESGFSISYYLPSRLNFWAIPSVQDQLLGRLYPLPTEDCLRKNYDAAAKKNGFNYDSESGLYLRKK